MDRLTTILGRAFDAPDAKENLEFWNHVVFHHETGCGDPLEFRLTGWLSAFCVFSDKGKWIGPPVGEVSRRVSLSGADGI